MSSTSINDFYTTLFDPGQMTCFAENKYGTAPYLVEGIQKTYPAYDKLQYFAINALSGTRADSNVVCYRNILIENDRVSLQDQQQMIKDLKIPYSSIVYSGNKSFHCIISMETALPTRQIYDFVVQWVFNIINDGMPEERQFDRTTKNPSRFSRVPGGTNVKFDKDGNLLLKKAQPLLEVKGRVPDETLQSWLLSYPQHQPKEPPRATGDGVIIKADRLVSSQEAEDYCREKWPLMPGEKQGNMYSWARYLAAWTSMTRDQIVDMIYENDEGKNGVRHEYERAVDRSLGAVEEETQLEFDS